MQTADDNTRIRTRAPERGTFARRHPVSFVTERERCKFKSMIAELGRKCALPRERQFTDDFVAKRQFHPTRPVTICRFRPPSYPLLTGHLPPDSLGLICQWFNQSIGGYYADTYFGVGRCQHRAHWSTRVRAGLPVEAGS